MTSVILAALLLGSGCGGRGGCDPPRQWVECRFGQYKCCLPEEECCYGAAGRYSSLSQIPRPDLSYTNLDGLVDFGRTKIRVEIPSDNDYFETNLKGRIAIVGGVCPQPPCDLQVILAELMPLNDNITSVKGRSIKGMFVRNANIWKGSRLSDATIKLDLASELAMEAIIDGEKKGTIVNTTNEFKGALHYDILRMTSSGHLTNNLISITGSFADENTKVELTIKIWATNCEPIVTPSVQCMPSIEPGGTGYVIFDSDFSMLGNLQNSQDLCDAFFSPKYENECTSGGTAEFPTFTCKKKPLPSSNNKGEIAKLLKFIWKDANGIVFSDQYSVTLKQLPVFPVTLTVENKWGKTVSATLKDPPICRSDVKLAPGASAWVELSGPRSHQRSGDWCPEGSFLTALDLQGDGRYSAHDAPLVGYALCSAPKNADFIGWEECSWIPIGRRSHQQGDRWCPENAFLTALDLDSDGALSIHDSPIVGQARCCVPKGFKAIEKPCVWTEIGIRSHQRRGSWCPEGYYLSALDLDGDQRLSGHDAPVVGRALCCPIED